MTGLVPVGAQHAALLAALHGAVFAEEKWDESAMLSVVGLFGFQGAVLLEPEPIGLLLGRVAADEAEILTLGVLPGARRHGAGSRLLAWFTATARRVGACRVFLEVAEDNLAALALYRRAGFAAVGRRPRYHRGEGGRRAALTLRLTLPECPKKSPPPRA
jgi:[ribosomal protein S18]-alanine N-acetyltransferase